MGNISIHEPDSKEYKRLQEFCDYINSQTPDRFEFFLKDIYFDFGQDWMYTGIVTKDKLDRKTGELTWEKNTWQTVCPRDYEAILNASEDEKEITFKEVKETVLESSLYEDKTVKNKKAIIITSKDEIKTVNYNGYDTLSDGVGGLIERIGAVDIETGIGVETKCDIYCNEEGLFLNTNDCNKVNGFATIVYNNPVYGNIVIVPQIDTLEGPDNDGFENVTINGEQEICPCWMAEDLLSRFINHNKENIEDIHKQYDDYKPSLNSQMEIVSFDNFDEMDFD